MKLGQNFRNLEELKTNASTSARCCSCRVKLAVLASYNSQGNFDQHLLISAEKYTPNFEEKTPNATGPEPVESISRGLAKLLKLFLTLMQLIYLRAVTATCGGYSQERNNFWLSTQL